jgi:hypothetical protein
VGSHPKGLAEGRTLTKKMMSNKEGELSYAGGAFTFFLQGEVVMWNGN